MYRWLKTFGFEELLFKRLHLKVPFIIVVCANILNINKIILTDTKKHPFQEY